MQKILIQVDIPNFVGVIYRIFDSFWFSLMNKNAYPWSYVSKKNEALPDDEIIIVKISTILKFIEYLNGITEPWEVNSDLCSGLIAPLILYRQRDRFWINFERILNFRCYYKLELDEWWLETLKRMRERLGDRNEE